MDTVCFAVTRTFDHSGLRVPMDPTFEDCHNCVWMALLTGLYGAMALPPQSQGTTQALRNW